MNAAGSKYSSVVVWQGVLCVLVVILSVSLPWSLCIKLLHKLGVGSSAIGFFGGILEVGGSGGDNIAVAIMSVAVTAMAACDDGTEGVGRKDTDNEVVINKVADAKHIKGHNQILAH